MKRILTVLAAVVCLCGCEKFFTLDSMRSIKQITILGLLLCVFSSCGFDKLHNNTECDFYIDNESRSSIVFTLQCYKQETSEVPTVKVVSINNDECKPIFKGMAIAEGFSFSDEEIFNKTLIGDVRDDSYAEVQISDNGGKIRWDPNAIDETSFYSQDNWLFEETEKNGKIYKKWTFIIDASQFEQDNKSLE